jgi:hypothetical protein
MTENFTSKAVNTGLKMLSFGTGSKPPVRQKQGKHRVE